MIPGGAALGQVPLGAQPFSTIVPPPTINGEVIALNPIPNIYVTEPITIPLGPRPLDPNAVWNYGAVIVFESARLLEPNMVFGMALSGPTGQLYDVPQPWCYLGSVPAETQQGVMAPETYVVSPIPSQVLSHGTWKAVLSFAPAGAPPMFTPSAFFNVPVPGQRC